MKRPRQFSVVIKVSKISCSSLCFCELLTGGRYSHFAGLDPLSRNYPENSCHFKTVLKSIDKICDSYNSKKKSSVFRIRCMEM